MDIVENKHGKKISITIPSELSFSPKIREFVTSFLKKDSDFSNKWIWRLVLMIDEMVNNAIEHWSDWIDNQVEITLISFHNKNMKIKVKDNWKKWNTIKANDLMERVRINSQNMKNNIKFNTTVRWRGLCQIVYSWSDEFYYEDNEWWWLTWVIQKNYNEECSKNSEKDTNNIDNQVNKKTIKIQTLSF